MNPRIATPTRLFIDTWLDLALGDDVTELPRSARVRRLITDRERQLKGRLARLGNDLALKNWRGASGVGRLSYRWDPQVRQLTSDIQKGLASHA